MSHFQLTQPTKFDPSLADDEAQFTLVEAAVAAQREAVEARLDEVRRAPAGGGQAAVERDIEIRRLAMRARLLREHRADLVLGKLVFDDGRSPVFVGRLGLTDRDANQLLVDWRTSAAEPFFAATHAHPMGLASRRRYQWSGSRVVDYWDEAFTDAELSSARALDDQSSFIASLGASRSPQMRDVLTTIAADQDAIIRSDGHGVLVVDGGPGTGKTVVALHRAAYLMYADARVSAGGVLFVGPHRGYLDYAGNVLPSLGEDRVTMCTPAGLVTGGETALDEPDGRVAALKSSARLLAAIDPAVAFYEEPPNEELTLETRWGDLTITPEDWREAFASPEPGQAHNDARDQVSEFLVDILVDQVPDREELDEPTVRRILGAHPDLLDELGAAWPILDPAELVSDLWAVPAFLRLGAPWLSDEERRLLRREEGSPWTTADLPFLDVARRRVGDPAEVRRRRRRERELASEAKAREAVATSLIAADDTEMQVMSMLRGDDLSGALLDEERGEESDPLAGPFAHVIVDEAQELTDAQWRMLHDRCPGGSFTVVGDRAQARRGFPEGWVERLERAGFHDVRVARLDVNYRTPAPIMEMAAAEICAVLPDANVPRSVRPGGPVRRYSASEVGAVVDDWLATHDGIVAVIGADFVPGPAVSSPQGDARSVEDRDGFAASFPHGRPRFVEDGDGLTASSPQGDPHFVEDGAKDRGTASSLRRDPATRVSVLTAAEVKGLEFDLVVVDPAALGDGLTGAVDRYVAMTRATSELVLVD